MTSLKTSRIYYLTDDFVEFTDCVKICSNDGFSITINKLFLVAFSPLLKSTFENLPDAEEIIISSEFNKNDIKIVTDFCSMGILPLPLETISTKKPEELIKLFMTFGIDLLKVLFENAIKKDEIKTQDTDHIIFRCKENSEKPQDTEHVYSEIKTEDGHESELVHE